MRKGFTPILIVLVISLVILSSGAIYYLKLRPISAKSVQTLQGNATTKNWKSYSDPDLNISFKYPQDWIVDKEGVTSLHLHNYSPIDSGKPYSSSQDNGRQKSVQNKGEYLITISDPTGHGSINVDEMVKRRKNRIEETRSDVIRTEYNYNQKEFKVNTHKAFYVEAGDKNHSYGYGTTYLLDGKGGGVTFSVGRDIAGSQTFLTDIMSTAQFLEKPAEAPSVTKEKDYNDIRSASDVAVTSSAVSWCIGVQRSKKMSPQSIFSTNAGGCGNKEYLVENNFLETKQVLNPVHFLNNSTNTKICLFSDNSSGHGIVSWDSDTFKTTEAGKSNSTSSCI